MENRLIARLRADAIHKQRTLALPECADRRVMAAGWQLLTEGAVRSVVFGSTRSEGLRLAKSWGLDFAAFGQRVVWANDDYVDLEAATRQSHAALLAKRGKAIDPDKVAAFASSPLTQAGHLLATGQVDAVVAGAVHTTADVIRAALGTVGLRPGVRSVSGSFIMNREREDLGKATYLYADCGVIIDPTVDQLVDIATATVETWRSLMPDQEPVVAFLSFSTRGSASHPAQEKIAEATALFRAAHPDVKAEGDIQFDAAFDATIGERKCPGSLVPGRANCFIFPNLDAGNIAYKITQRLGLFDAYGPILQGTARPFSDLSRGASQEDIVAASYLTVLRA